MPDSRSVAEDFNAYLTDNVGADPYPAFRRMREEAPVVWAEPLQAWVLTRWDDITAMLEDTENFGALMNRPGTSSIFGRAILQMSGDEHRRKDAILAKRLRGPRYLGSTIEEIVSGLVREYGDELPVAPEVADLRTGLTEPVPLGAIAELMDMGAASNFRNWYNDIVAAGTSNFAQDPAVHARGETARDELYDFVTPSIEERRGCPGDELLSDLCSMEYEGERLSDDEVRSFTAFLLSAGIETTDRALANLVKHLILQPEQWQRLKDDPSLASSAATEILRFRPPVQAIVRMTKQDMEVSGTVIPAENKLMGFIASANHDPDRFDNPGVFDVGRFEGAERPNYTPIGPVRAFGAGPHTCTGSLLAKLEMERTLEYMVERFDHFEFAGDVPPDTGIVLRSPETLDVVLHPAA
ncbi:cytochrome P450 [Candidatus Poriferisocius sp.]|uniref:cytochrome P450 n=1 Tax=Candidatus Poriferisocius sp. TaxID=3101276 RepID=UPI003B0136EA